MEPSKGALDAGGVLESSEYKSTSSSKRVQVRGRSRTLKEVIKQTKGQIFAII